MKSGLTVGVVSSPRSILLVKLENNYQDHIFSRSVLTTLPVGHLPS